MAMLLNSFEGTSGNAFDAIGAPPSGGTPAFDNAKIVVRSVRRRATSGNCFVTWSTSMGTMSLSRWLLCPHSDYQEIPDHPYLGDCGRYGDNCAGLLAKVRY